MFISSFNGLDRKKNQKIQRKILENKKRLSIKDKIRNLSESASIEKYADLCKYSIDQKILKI